MADAHTTFASPVGPLSIQARAGKVIHVDFGRVLGDRAPKDPALLQAIRELQEYFAGRRRQFTVPTARPDRTTAFQHRLWDALLRIPYGETRTYGELAAQLGTSARAVGGACGRNPLPILVPCHRVVAKAGLGGYSGDWESGLATDVKAVLLALEANAGSPK